MASETETIRAKRRRDLELSGPRLDHADFGEEVVGTGYAVEDGDSTDRLARGESGASPRRQANASEPASTV
jgi:hypothetical protein